LPGLVLNRDPPDLCLLSSWDYRHEPPAPGLSHISNLFVSFIFSLSVIPLAYWTSGIQLSQFQWPCLIILSAVPFLEWISLFLAWLGFELRTLHLLGRCSITSATAVLF
jgi:hypothetical protein